MSEYHIIGIDKQGRMQQVANGDFKAAAIAEAENTARNYRQLFLVQAASNVKALNIQTPLLPPRLIEGSFTPNVQ